MTYDWFLRSSNDDRNSDFEKTGTYAMRLMKEGDKCNVSLALKKPEPPKEEETKEEGAYKTLASLTVLGAAYVASQM